MKDRIDKALKKHLPTAIAIFLLSQPLLDALTALGSQYDLIASISLIIRGVFMVFAFVYLLLEKKWRVMALIIAGFGLMFAVYNIVFASEYMFSNIVIGIKVFYLPILMMFFASQKLKMSNDINRLYLVMLLTYMLLIILPTILGISAVDSVNYDGKIWNRGLFSAGNDIAAILICLSPVVLTSLMKEKKWVMFVVTSILLVVSGILIGTKAVMVCLLAIAIFLLIIASRSWSRKVKVGVAGGIVGFLVGITCLLPFTPVYQNTLIALEYHQVDSADDLVKPEIIDRVILSERPTFFIRLAEMYQEVDWGQKLFGLNQTEEYKAVESDPADIFFAVGLFGVVIYVSFVVYFCRRIDWKSFFVAKKFSMIMLLVLAVVVGHVLLTPAVSTIFASLFCGKIKE